MKPLKGSETEQNLIKSFAGESQARNRYTFYASQADREGFKQIGRIFTETAANEKEHAERFFNLMLGGLTEQQPVGIALHDAEYPVAKGTTLQNLQYAAEGEHHEGYELYPAFEKAARSEGFDEIAEAFKNIAAVENRHEQRFFKLAQNIRDGRVFKRNAPVLWRCSNCGYVYEGLEAPVTCPSCLHPQSFFELFTENY